MQNKLYLKQIEVGPMENFIYLIGDKAKRECVMVDPAWEVDRVLKIAESDGLKVTAGLLTHYHYDHVNGVPDLIAKTQGKIYANKNDAEYLKGQGLASHLEKIDSGHKIRVGEIEITFLHTPGHTPGSQCFLVTTKKYQLPFSQRGEKVADTFCISGDTLFIGACGRCDLPGGNPEELYQSLQRLAKLDDSVILMPGHNYADTPTSTIGDEKKTNPYYQIRSLSDFLGLRMG